MWNTTTVLNAMAINSAESPVPAWVELIPIGEVIGRDGRCWSNNNPAAVIQAFEKNRVDLPVDLEHATELKATKGDPAPAVGWIKELKIMDEAIWGRVSWNPTGNQLIATQQYRYLSPVIMYGKGDGAIVALSSVGLTNRPNLPLRALNQHGASGQAGFVRALNAEEKKICSLMGVAEADYLRTLQDDLAQQYNTLSSALNADERRVCMLMGISEAEYLRTRA